MVAVQVKTHLYNFNIIVLDPYKDSSTILELAVILNSANINLSYNIIAAVFSL